MSISAFAYFQKSRTDSVRVSTLSDSDILSVSDISIDYFFKDGTESNPKIFIKRTVTNLMAATQSLEVYGDVDLIGNVDDAYNQQQKTVETEKSFTHAWGFTFSKLAKIEAFNVVTSTLGGYVVKSERFNNVYFLGDEFTDVQLNQMISRYLDDYNHNTSALAGLTSSDVAILNNSLSEHRLTISDSENEHIIKKIFVQLDEIGSEALTQMVLDEFNLQGVKLVNPEINEEANKSDLNDGQGESNDDDQLNESQPSMPSDNNGEPEAEESPTSEEESDEADTEKESDETNDDDELNESPPSTQPENNNQGSEIEESPTSEEESDEADIEKESDDTNDDDELNESPSSTESDNKNQGSETEELPTLEEEDDEAETDKESAQEETSEIDEHENHPEESNNQE